MTERKILCDGEEVLWANNPSCVKGYTCGQLYLALSDYFRKIESDETLPKHHAAIVTYQAAQRDDTVVHLNTRLREDLAWIAVMLFMDPRKDPQCFWEQEHAWLSPPTWFNKKFYDSFDEYLNFLIDYIHTNDYYESSHEIEFQNLTDNLP